MNPRVALVALAVAVAVPACVAADQPVLNGGPTLATCAEVLARQHDEQACSFDSVCTWSDAQEPNGIACCTYFAVCADGRLLIESMCPSECQRCMTDAECPRGQAWCDATTCAACTDPAMCAACPPGTEPVLRNGCATCTCAPPSQCDASDPLACDAMESCYRGQVCATGCAPGELDCCANVCAAPGCAEPAPLGCRMDCPQALGCTSCMASACTCNAGVWSCTPACSDVVGPCFLP